MDTIVACATPMGRSGIAVIRLSGPESLTVTQGLCQSKGFSDRQATLRRIFDGETCIDQVLVLWMKGPNSFTGEDVVEISCHGNPIVIQHIIELCMKRGARLARAGEFSRRAATNGKLSLIQAESLSALLSAKSRSAVVASQRGMNGDIENKIDHIQDRLLDYAAEIEARLDHPDGDLSYIDDQSLS
ncbi:MAG: tRNA uridine-5-carboxymethylaminomethyl(34) synthesis GTPase MnmE, partial [Myxococcota bacterium]|nr:tRNA uridine-5-carboxymethylaminomethyl(34) synthesis GTPase MnmE [Myxococcota bacterium]